VKIILKKGKSPRETFKNFKKISKNILIKIVKFSFSDPNSPIAVQ